MSDPTEEEMEATARRISDKLREELRPPSCAKVFGALGVIMITSALAAPVTALMLTYYASKIWGWFLSDVGAGPTRGQWFGVISIVHLMTAFLIAPTDAKTTKKGIEHPIQMSIERTLTSWFLYAAFFVITWGTGAVLGYIR